MRNPTAKELQIAQELERIAQRAIYETELAMNTLRLPASVRAPIWQAISRRAMVKVLEAEREPT